MSVSAAQIVAKEGRAIYHDALTMLQNCPLEVSPAAAISRRRRETMMKRFH